MKKVIVLLFCSTVLIFGGIIALASKPALHAPQTALHAPTATHTQHFEPTATNTPAMACSVAVDALNIRSCASVGCVVVGSVKRAETVNIEQKVNGWMRIDANKWVNSAFLECDGAK